MADFVSLSDAKSSLVGLLKRSTEGEEQMDADIAGPGVIIGFTLANAVTVLASAALLWLNSHIDQDEDETSDFHPHHMHPYQSRYSSAGLAERLAPPQQTLGSLYSRSSRDHSPGIINSAEDFTKYHDVRAASVSTSRTPIPPTSFSTPPFFLGIRKRVWRAMLSDFVLQLSDQQLLTGLLLLIVGLGKYYQSALHKGENNMWTAGDIVVFSSVTHGATLLALQPYFRHHRGFATFRWVIMWIIFAIWLVVAATILQPVKPTTSDKLGPAWTRFWHGVTYIEALGVVAMYLVCYLPIWVRGEWWRVRQIIAKRQVLQAHHVAALHASAREKRKGPIKQWLEDAAVDFSQRYAAASAHPNRRLVLAALAELFFPWYSAVMLVFALWLLGCATMICDLMLSGLMHTWSFGQLLPPALILLPLYSLVSSVIEKRAREKELRVIVE